MNKDSLTFYTDQNIANNVGEEKAGTSELNSQNWDYVPPVTPASSAVWSSDTFYKEIVADTPQEIIDLAKMSRQEPWLVTRNKSFFEQALYMADYADDAQIVPFFEYFPVYRSMNIAQLRSYFTLRRMLRKDQYPDVSLSYIFVYIYEILMQVGIKNPHQGLGILENIKNVYSVSQPKLIRYLRLWIRDYIVYYDLTESIGDYFADQIQEDTIAKTLVDYQNSNDELLFQTVSSLSAYKIKTASLFKKHPDKMITVVSRVVKATAPIYELRYGHSLDELCLGVRKQTAHPMFVSAIFYSSHPVKEKTLEISSRRCYYCKGGLWLKDTFEEKIFTKKGELLGQILHETDRRLRISLKVKPSMVTKMDDKEIEGTIQSIINNYLHELEEASRPKIQVDFSKLDKIRSDADIIRDALLSEDEESLNEPLRAETLEAPQLENVYETVEQESASLTKQERDFLRLLMDGNDWKSYLQNIRVPIGVITDNINEKLMKDINDIIIDDDGNGPIILEEYKDYISNRI